MSVFQKWSASIKDSSTFADRLVSLVIKHAFTLTVLKAKSLTTKYEKLWAEYHQLIVGDELPTLWHSVLDCTENQLFF